MSTTRRDYAMRPANRAAIAVLRAYRRGGGGSALGVDCNFVPSCSSYALEAYRTRPFLAATRLALGRVCRCNDRAQLEPERDPLPETEREV